MQTNEIQTALAEAVEEVLETMCFSGVFSSSETEGPEAGECGLLSAPISAMLRFEGNPPGEFRLRIPMKPARMLGSGFLGKDEAEISDAQAEEVVCELANMFCGSALSRLESGTIFRLSHPELTSEEPAIPFAQTGTARWFELEEGCLAASLKFQQAS